MAKKQEIENGILSMNPAAFQELADDYLSKVHPEWMLQCRSGSQLGKQKTIKGTPDSVFTTRAGSFVLVQHSTDSTNVVNKLKLDIDKCMDTSKTNIPLCRIESIVLCTNFRLSPGQVAELMQYNAKVELFSIDRITQGLFLSYPTLISKHLGLESGPVQLVDIGDFVEQNDTSAKKLSTPLQIPFKHRSKELTEVIEALRNNDVIIIKGVAGSGKTRFAVEVCQRLASTMKCLSLRCSSFIQTTEIDSLKHETADIMLFVDDVNRVSGDVINYILDNFLKKGSPVRKLLLTVRNYSAEEVEKLLQEYKVARFSLSTLTDDEIREIISDSPFEVLNSAYQERILEIADGNPRLAIMASLLAIQEQSLDSLHNVAELFSLYFSRVEKDVPSVRLDNSIKVLGLLGFFNSIDLSDGDLFTEILEAFGLEHDVFLEACRSLNENELVDIGLEVAKIAEQNLGLYFFWNAFFNKKLLSFDTLLNNFFCTHLSRFRDMLIPLANLFDYSQIKKSINRSLLSYSNKVEGHDKRDFFELFYPFIPEETLSYVLSNLDGLEVVNCAVYQTEYNPNDYSGQIHTDLFLLGELCRMHYGLLIDALEGMIEIVRRRPEEMPHMIYTICSAFTINLNDARNNFHRQKQLLEYFAGLVSDDDPVAKAAFPKLANLLLQFSYQYTSSRRHNKFSICTIDIKNEENILFIREKVWQTLSLFSPDCVNDVLMKYEGIVRGHSMSVVEYDCHYFSLLIQTHLNPALFAHCLTVHKLKKWLGRLKIINSEFDEVSRLFTNPAFEMYLAFICRRYPADGIDWERGIREAFLIDNEAKQNAFISNCKIILSGVDDRERSLVMEAIDLVVDESLAHSFSMGLSLLTSLISTVNYAPFLPVATQLHIKNRTARVWKAISKSDIHSKLHFFASIPSESITRLWGERFVEVIQTLPSGVVLRCTSYKLLLDKLPGLTKRVLRYVVESRRSILDDDWIDYAIEARIPIQLIEASYLTCRHIRHFDFDASALLVLLRQDKQFLLRYLESFSINEEIPSLGNLWALKDNEMMRNGFIFLIEHNWEIFDGIYNQLFDSIPDAYLPDAEAFILSFVQQNYADVMRMNAVVDVIESKMQNMRRPVVHAFLGQTFSCDLFSGINWIKETGIFYWGEFDPIEQKVRRLNMLLEDVTSSSLGVRLNPIKAYIEGKIALCEQEMVNYRKKRFVDL